MLLAGWMPVGLLAATPPTRPATTAPAGPSEAERQRASALGRRAIGLMQQKKYAQAEKTLEQALELNPSQPTNLYNMACVKALLGRGEEAMRYLERSALAGFTDFGHIERDVDLQSLRSLPAYQRFVARKNNYQRAAAQRILDWLKRELGEGYLHEIDEQNKLIFVTNTDQQTLAAIKKRLLLQAGTLRELLFAHQPDQYISVVLPSPEDYKEIVKRPNVGGFYNHDLRILIAARLGQVMAHEFTHALHNADLDPLGQEHPTWVGEGLGTLFEHTRFEGERLVPADGLRLATIQDAVRRGRSIPFQRLVAMDSKSFTADAVAGTTYSEAGSVMMYLYEKNLLRPFYDTFKTLYEQDKTGKLALERVTGKKLADVEKDWKAWMLARRGPRLNTGPDGAVVGIRFENANDGMKIQALVPGGPAEQAGLQVEDVIIGIDDLEARDPTYMLPLLGARSPGDRVVLKIRRGEQYLDVPVTLGRRAEVNQGQRPAAKR